jgi:Pentapeptide repeats (8 copies)
MACPDTPRTVAQVEELADLRADCTRCSALCCVALPYAASADFAVDKPAGQPCRHLDAFSCTIHAQLPERGFAGCTVFDCLGAGQLATQHTYAGVTWRDRPDLAGEIFDAFSIIRQLQELRWYLRQADRTDQPTVLRQQIWSLAEATRELTALPAEELRQIDVADHRAAVDGVLSEVSRRVRTAAARSVGDRTGRPGRTRRADLVGARLAGVDLRGCDFRSALLLGADLRGADLRGGDLIGADLRGADLRGADLSTALYVTEPQVAAAHGDAWTHLPVEIRRPVRWGAS